VKKKSDYLFFTLVFLCVLCMCVCLLWGWCDVFLYGGVGSELNIYIYIFHNITTISLEVGGEKKKKKIKKKKRKIIKSKKKIIK